MGSWLRARRWWDSARELLDAEARRTEAAFEKLRTRFYREYWSAAARAVGAEIDDLGRDYLRVRRGDQWTFVHRYEVELDPHLTLKIAGDKPLTHRLLAEHGYRAPRFREFTYASRADAERFLAELGGPAVVKPASGTGGGNGVTTGVRTGAELRRAAWRAAAWHGRLLLEEQVDGHSYRLLYLGGRFVDAVRRDPPALEGDGRRSVSELMRAENRRRLEASPVSALHPLVPDLACDVALRAQGLRRSSVPEAGRRVIAKSVPNQNAARENHCVRDEVHPSIVEMGREIVTLFGIELGGLDLLTPDIAVPLQECGGVINEVNTTPGLHHHALVSDASKPVPVAEMILEHVFARTAAREAVALAASQVAPA